MVSLTLLHPREHTIVQQWHFRDQSVIHIGRSLGNDIVLDKFPKVSRHHLELRQVNVSVWQLTSKGTNGTFLNGTLITQSLIKNEDLIRLCRGGPLLRFNTQAVGELAQANNGVVPPKPKICNHAGNPANSLFCMRCGQPLVEQEKFIGQYQILRQLGQGGMGTTYVAWDKKSTVTISPQLLVLKEMNAEMANNRKAQELFAREARILKNLDHPGIPKYYDFFSEGDKNYLAMELIHGQNLEQRIYGQGVVSFTQAVAWMLQLCEILTYLHSLNPPLVHRDIKPANLMLRHRDSRIMLLDFGAVKEIGTPFATRIGAAGYSAPEQDDGKPCPQSDIYAIGSTLIFLLTGQEPISFCSRKVGRSRFNLERVSQIVPRLRQIINKACASKVSLRYQDAQELAQALAACF